MLEELNINRLKKFEERIKKGYVYIKIDNKWVQKHRQIAENTLGRKLDKKEKVHHQDRNPLNNSVDNLMLFENQKSHKSFENKEAQFGRTRYVLEEIERRKMGYRRLIRSLRLISEKKCPICRTQLNSEEEARNHCIKIGLTGKEKKGMSAMGILIKELANKKI